MSNIEWTDVTWNPVIGCTPISAGCLNCYAATMANRMQGMQHAKDYQLRQCGYCGGTGAVERSGSDLGCPACNQQKVIRIAEVRGGRAVFTGDIRTLEHRLAEPLSWKKPRRVFVCSMSDLFHPRVPFEFIDRVFAIMALCPEHTFQVLTKRPERMDEYAANHGRLTSVAQAAAMMGHAEQSMRITWPLPNVWLGTSVEDQKAADTRIPHLLKCPAAVRFLSCEPLLGPVDLNCNIGGTRWLGGQRGCNGSHRHAGRRGEEIHGVIHDCDPRELHHHHDERCSPGINWVIIGGESGSNARLCEVAWIRSIVKQCQDAGVPPFVKQLGSRPVTGVTDRDDQGCAIKWREWKLRDRAGADMAEWAEDLRIRQFPGGATC